MEEFDSYVDINPYLPDSCAVDIICDNAASSPGNIGDEEEMFTQFDDDVVFMYSYQQTRGAVYAAFEYKKTYKDGCPGEDWEESKKTLEEVLGPSSAYFSYAYDSIKAYPHYGIIWTNLGWNSTVPMETCFTECAHTEYEEYEEVIEDDCSYSYVQKWVGGALMQKDYYAACPEGLDCPECYRLFEGECIPVTCPEDSIFDPTHPECCREDHNPIFCGCNPVPKTGGKWDGITGFVEDDLIQNPSVLDPVVATRAPYATNGDDYERGFHDRIYLEEGYSKGNEYFYDYEVINVKKIKSLSVITEFTQIEDCETKTIPVYVSVNYYVQIDKNRENKEESTITISLNGESNTRVVSPGGYSDVFIAEFYIEFTDSGPTALTASVTFNNMYGGVRSLFLRCGPKGEPGEPVLLSLEILEDYVCNPMVQGLYEFGPYGYTSNFIFMFASAYATEYNLKNETPIYFTDLYYIEYITLVKVGDMFEIVDIGTISSDTGEDILIYTPNEEIFNKHGWEIARVIVKVVPKDVRTLNFLPDPNIFSPTDEGLGRNYPYNTDKTWRGDVLFATFTDKNEYGTGRTSSGCEFRDLACNQDYIYPSFNDCDGYIDPCTDTDSCCDYMPKDFIAWSYGWNMRQLTPPNER